MSHLLAEVGMIPCAFMLIGSAVTIVSAIWYAIHGERRGFR